MMMAWSAERMVLVFGLGVQELLLILLAVVFLFGAKKIPEIARGLGKGLSEFKKGVQESDEGAKKDQDSTRESSQSDRPESGSRV